MKLKTIIWLVFILITSGCSWSPEQHRAFSKALEQTYLNSYGSGYSNPGYSSSSSSRKGKKCPAGTCASTGCYSDNGYACTCVPKKGSCAAQ